MRTETRQATTGSAVTRGRSRRQRAWLASSALPALALALVALLVPVAPAAATVIADMLPPGWPSDARSTTGPVRPAGVSAGAVTAAIDSPVLIPDVPAYLWYRGCGPTALGMVIGCWRGRGYQHLIPGDATGQNADVNAAISSDGNYLDYCLPLDYRDSDPSPIPDKSEPPEGDEHPDDCIADFMYTSQSYWGNYYGWSHFSDVAPAFQSYVDYRDPTYGPLAYQWYWGSSLTWESFRSEIDAGRPVVFLVDTGGDNRTDHFIAAIGYGWESEAETYACLDTWDTSVHWYEFQGMASGQLWGIYGAIAMDFTAPATHLWVTVAPPEPTRVPSAGTATLSGAAADDSGHAVVGWLWDDAGAGGVFLPTATTTAPAYTAPGNETGVDLSVTLTLSATCDGAPPQTRSSSAVLTVTWDFDDDGMPDFWEQLQGLDQLAPGDALLDGDGDGLTNLQEYQSGSDPGSGDTDGDGLPDLWEVQHDLDPAQADDLAGDADNDGLSLWSEYERRTDPADRDTDGDGFGDGEEVSLGSDPAGPLDKPDHGHFSDVTPTGYGPSATDPFWAFHEIEACFRAGIVGGYLDGSYQPGWPVSRDQMAVYIARAVAGGDANVPKDYSVPSFTDVPTDNWAFHYIEYAAELNVVRGYEDGSYQPLVTVDRGAMAVYIARSVVDPIGDDSSLPRPVLPSFPDVPTQFWSYPHVEYCVAEGVVKGYDDGLYHPEFVVSRDQMAVYIARAFEVAM